MFEKEEEQEVKKKQKIWISVQSLVSSDADAVNAEHPNPEQHKANRISIDDGWLGVCVQVIRERKGRR